MVKIFYLFSLVFISIFVLSIANQNGNKSDGPQITFEEYEIREYQKFFNKSEEAITLDNMFSIFKLFHNISVQHESNTNIKINLLTLHITRIRNTFLQKEDLIKKYKLTLKSLQNRKQILEEILVVQKEINATMENIDEAKKELFEITSRNNQNKIKDSALNSEVVINKQKLAALRLAQGNNPETYKLEIEKLKLMLNRCTSCCKAKSCTAFGNSTDIHMIHVNEKTGAVNVSCNGQLADAGPGWTVIQRRIDGSENFYRNWDDYKVGFGNLSGEFFIGLEKLHQMTGEETQELYIQLEDFNNKTKFARYDNFKVGNENSLYELLSLGEYSGNAEDALTDDVGYGFSTFDRGSSSDEATSRYSAWWYDENGSLSNLNGRYIPKGKIVLDYQGTSIFWYSSQWHDIYYSFKSVHMMIRPKSYDHNSSTNTF